MFQYSIFVSLTKVLVSPLGLNPFIANCSETSTTTIFLLKIRLLTLHLLLPYPATSSYLIFTYCSKSSGAVETHHGMVQRWKQDTWIEGTQNKASHN